LEPVALDSHLGHSPGLAGVLALQVLVAGSHLGHSPDLAGLLALEVLVVGSHLGHGSADPVGVFVLAALQLEVVAQLAFLGTHTVDVAALAEMVAQLASAGVPVDVLLALVARTALDLHIAAALVASGVGSVVCHCLAAVASAAAKHVLSWLCVAVVVPVLVGAASVAAAAVAELVSVLAVVAAVFGPVVPMPASVVLSPHVAAANGAQMVLALLISAAEFAQIPVGSSVVLPLLVGDAEVAHAVLAVALLLLAGAAEVADAVAVEKGA
jgi:hypothetical protein